MLTRYKENLAVGALPSLTEIEAVLAKPSEASQVCVQPSGCDDHIIWHVQCNALLCSSALRTTSSTITCQPAREL